MKKEEIIELINIANELKKVKNNKFFLIKGMIIERSSEKKDRD